MKIKNIFAREIIDSRGNPTIETRVEVGRGIIGIAKVPSGASTGIHEALELRDKDKKRYNGKGVLKACNNVNTKIAQALKGVRADQQKKIDETMIALDGTKNKGKLGANAILSVSLACAHAASEYKKIPLYRYINSLHNHNTAMNIPQAMMNILNGGAHANWSTDVQEFMVMPKASTMKKQVQIGAEIFSALKEVLKAKKLTALVGDEGGFAPSLKSNVQAFDLIEEAITKAGYKAGKNVFFAIDAAASEFYQKKTKKYKLLADKKTVGANGMISLYEDWIKKYPIKSIEDGLDEDDWKNWEKMTKKLGKKTMQVGDDLFVTSSDRLQKGIETGVANAILIKLNQIGTLTETLDAIYRAQQNGYDVIISHRSGETTDTTIADLAVGVGAGYIKTGSLSRSERTSKYNRLMEIELELM